MFTAPRQVEKAHYRNAWMQVNSSVFMSSNLDRSMQGKGLDSSRPGEHVGYCEPTLWQLPKFWITCLGWYIFVHLSRGLDSFSAWDPFHPWLWQIVGVIFLIPDTLICSILEFIWKSIFWITIVSQVQHIHMYEQCNVRLSSTAPILISSTRKVG